MSEKKGNLFASAKRQLKKLFPTAKDINIKLSKKVENTYESKIQVVMPDQTLHATKEGENPRVTVDKSVDAVKKQGDKIKGKKLFSFRQKEKAKQ